MEEIMVRFLKPLGCLVLIMTFAVAIAMLPPSPLAPVTEAAVVAETRCGWFHNPTPSNAWLIDAAGEWTISVQGGYQAEGDWPDFSAARWVKTNVHYGYGCACMKVTTNRAEQRVLRIISSYSRALSACRKDKALKRKEPKE
jgi:hypothetical protein